MDPIDLRARRPWEAYLPIVLLVSLILIWAVSWPIIKVGVRDVTPQAHNGCRPRKRRRV